MSRLCGEMTEVCQDRIDFVRELESVAGVTVTVKTAMFLKQMMDKEEKEAKERALEIDWSVPKKMPEFMRRVQDKDILNLMKLQILRREYELRD
nr:hypothetical protein [Tanacetum cinerariifolium]